MFLKKAFCLKTYTALIYVVMQKYVSVFSTPLPLHTIQALVLQIILFILKQVNQCFGAPKYW